MTLDFKEVKTVGKNRYKILLGSLSPSLARSLSNALRRGVIQNVPGYAVTNVYLNGVRHPYMRLNNVKEDVLSILLNVKEVCLFSIDNARYLEKKYEFTGPCIVTARCLQDDELTVTNPDHNLFEITSDLRVELSIRVERRIGFQIEKFGNFEDNFLSVTSDHNPVKKAFCKVVDTAGGLSDCELFIETNGTVGPKEVVRHALYRYCNDLSLLLNRDEDKEVEQVAESAQDDIGGNSLDFLGLGTRAYNCLKAFGVNTIGDLLQHSYDDLRVLPNMGVKSLEQVVYKMSNHNLKLKTIKDI